MSAYWIDKSEEAALATPDGVMVAIKDPNGIVVAYCGVEDADRLVRAFNDEDAEAPGVPMSGVAAIGVERRRQVAREGWTPAHDDRHDGQELAWAAACYAAPRPIFIKHEMAPGDGGDVRGIAFVEPWPWAPEWDKRAKHARIRHLAIAGALIAAEYDRATRAMARGDEDPFSPRPGPDAGVGCEDDDV